MTDPVAATPDAVLSAVPTPFTAAGELDRDAAGRLFGFLAGTVGHLLVAGTTGEFPALTDAERLALIDIAVREAGPEGVVAHVGAADAHRAARLAATAVSLGVRTLAAITPYFLPARPDEIADYYRQVCAAAGGAPVYAYLFPERTGLDVTPAQLAGLAAIPGLAGVKLSGAASANLPAFTAAVPAGFHVYSGDDSDLPAVLAAGGAGVVSGVSAAMPEPFVELRSALRSGDRAGITRWQRRTAELAEVLGPSTGRLKHALWLRGLTTATGRMTIDAPDPATAARIAALVPRQQTVP